MPDVADDSRSTFPVEESRVLSEAAVTMRTSGVASGGASETGTKHQNPTFGRFEPVVQVLGALFILVSLLLLLQLAMRFHPVVGMGVAVFLVAGAIDLIRVIHGERLQASRWTTGIRFALVVGIGLLGWAAFSYISTVLGWPHFTASTVRPEQVLTFYVWTFLDLVPGLKVPSTLNFAAPLTTIDTSAGSVVLAFKAFVVWGVLNAFAKWRKGGASATG